MGRWSDLQPDVQACLEEVVSAIAGPDHVYTFLTVGFEKNLPAVHVDVSQSEEFPLATHTASIAVYDKDTTSARRLIRAVLAYFTLGQHQTSAGLIDRVQVDIPARQQPYADPHIALYTATVRIDTRAT